MKIKDEVVILMVTTVDVESLLVKANYGERAGGANLALVAITEYGCCFVDVRLSSESQVLRHNKLTQTLGGVNNNFLETPAYKKTKGKHVWNPNLKLFCPNAPNQESFSRSK